MDSLTDPAFIRRLESLYLLARKVLGGSLQADRKSTRRGAGITFADYSEYSLGDDYRAIDWRVYARMDELVIKLFEVEEDVTIHLLLDCSPSMTAKLLPAKQLAAALGYLGLSTLDRLAPYAMADGLRPIIEPAHGRGRILPFLRALDAAPTFGRASDLTACARALQARHRRRGMVLIISDFFCENGFDEALAFLAYHGHDVFCLQIQDASDRRFDYLGDVDLTCLESGRHHRLTITEADARAYTAAVDEWNQTLIRSCARRGIGLARTTSQVPFDRVIGDILRRGGLVA